MPAIVAATAGAGRNLATSSGCSGGGTTTTTSRTTGPRTTTMAGGRVGHRVGLDRDRHAGRLRRGRGPGGSVGFGFQGTASGTAGTPACSAG